MPGSQQFLRTSLSESFMARLVSRPLSLLATEYDSLGAGKGTFYRLKEKAVRPIKILQVSAFFAGHGGGIEVVAEKLGQAAALQGHQVTWMATGTIAQFPGASHLGMTCIRAPSIDLFEKSIGLPMPLWSFGALIRLWRQVGLADVIHIHDYLYFFFTHDAYFCFTSSKASCVDAAYWRNPLQKSFSKNSPFYY